MLDPTGAGAEKFLESVSEQAECEYLASRRYSYLVAEQNGEMVGFIAMRDGTHLFHLFVDIAHQGQGIARALWSLASKRASKAVRVSEFTVNASLNAVPVYVAFGFEPVGASVQAHGITFQPMRLAIQSDA